MSVPFYILSSPIKNSRWFYIFTNCISIPLPIHCAGSYDRTLRFWDPSTGVCSRVISTLHDKFIIGVALSTDSKQAATSSGDKTVKLWDVVTGECIHTLKGHLSYVFNISFSKDGTLLASGSHDKTARLWDTRSGTVYSSVCYLRMLCCKRQSDIISCYAMVTNITYIVHL